MNNGKTIADVLRGVIQAVPSWAEAILVLSALAGIACCALSAFQLYQAVQNERGTPLNWVAAFGLGATMTIVAIVVAQSSLLFSPAE